MFKGFYTATSGMLTQQRRLNTISNNMANVSTPGYKKDVLPTTTFEEVMAVRTGSIDKSRPAELNNISMIRVPDETATVYERGAFDVTSRPLDIALGGDGFFEVRTPSGQALYTRNGSFTLDDEGYLFLQHIGRVIGTDDEPILLRTDKLRVESSGNIVSEEGADLGTIKVVDFNDYNQLVKTAEGMFQNADPQNVQTAAVPEIQWKMLERSNVNAMDEMVAMMTSQRGLQSASQILKAYDQLMRLAANDIGKI